MRKTYKWVWVRAEDVEEGDWVRESNLHSWSVKAMKPNTSEHNVNFGITAYPRDKPVQVLVEDDF